MSFYVSDYGVSIEKSMEKKILQESSDATVANGNEENDESNISTSKIMMAEESMNYEKNDAIHISHVGMIEATSKDAVPDVSTKKRRPAFADAIPQRPSPINNECKEQQPSTSAIEDHEEFEFVHYPIFFEISRECFSPSNSFKENDIINQSLDQYSKIRGDESFLKHDTGINDPNRILFFSTQQNLQLLEASAYWGINCITKNIPKPFSQYWIIHGFYKQKAFPFVYFLLQSANDFERAMKLLSANYYHLPKHVMMDYSSKEYALAQRLFRTAKFHFCYFSFTASIMRKITSSHWVQYYRISEQFQIDIKAFMMLAFVKPADVIRYYNVLKESFNEIYSEFLKLDEFYEYMEEKWIGNSAVGKVPEIPVELWNVYDSTFNQYPRTNNYLKRWLTKFFGRFRLDNKESITIHDFIDAIKLEQNSNEFILNEMIFDRELPIFGKTNEAILKVIQEYDKYEPLNYLRAVSAASLPIKNPSRKRKNSVSNEVSLQF